MKVAFFTNTYLPISYGSVTSIRNFRRGLEELGHEVHIFTPNVKGYQDKEINIHRTPSSMYGYKIKYPIAHPWTRHPHKLAKKIGFDVIHCHQPYTVGYYGVNIGKELGLPVVFTHHCRYEDYVHYMPPVLPRKLLAWMVVRSATKYANKCQQIVAPAETIKKMISARGVARPITVIPTGIEWSRFQGGKREQTRKEYGIADEETLLLSNGRIDQEKNIEMMTGALFPLLKKNNKLKIIFVGEGSLRKHIEQAAKEKGIEKQVILTGVIAQEKIQDSYSAGDIFVQTSYTETQGMSLLEALAAGLAVVAVQATGSIDQVEHGKTGLLVENNKDKYAQMVKKVIEDKDLRRSLSENAKEEAKKCDYLVRTRQLLDVYTKALADAN